MATGEKGTARAFAASLATQQLQRARMIDVDAPD